MSDRELPKYVFRRKDSPQLWYKFKVNGKVRTGSCEPADVKSAEDFVAKQRGAAVSGKIMEKESDIVLAAVVKQDLHHCRKQPAYSTKKDGINNFLEFPVSEKKKIR